MTFDEIHPFKIILIHRFCQIHSHVYINPKLLSNVGIKLPIVLSLAAKSNFQSLRLKQEFHQTFSDPFSGDSKHFPFFPKKSKKSTPQGVGGVPQILFNPKYYFFGLKTPCKISKSYDNPFWEKSNRSRKRERREKEWTLSSVTAQLNRSDQND